MLPHLKMEDGRRMMEDVFDVRRKMEEGRVFAAALMILRIHKNLFCRRL